MVKHIMRIAAALVFVLALSGAAHCQILDQWFVRELYSNADGSVQFIKLELDIDHGAQQGLSGQTLIASNGSMERSFTILRDVDCVTCTGGDSATLLVATQGFADLGVGAPGAIVPNGFLFIPAGSLRLGASEVRYEALPTDGVHALYPHGLYWDDNIPDQPIIGTPVAVGVFMPGLNVVAEFHNDVLDDYFLTAYSTEMNLLDSGQSGWLRTGQTFSAWTSPVSVKAGELAPPNLLPVCRIWLGSSHFYSISASECAAVAQFPAFLETASAFYATLPHPDTGVCPVGQTPAYRLWNPNGSSHRYTTQVTVRDEMKARGWIAEGYGVDAVAMCVGG